MRTLGTSGLPGGEVAHRSASDLADQLGAVGLLVRLHVRTYLSLDPYVQLLSDSTFVDSNVEYSFYDISFSKTRDATPPVDYPDASRKLFDKKRDTDRLFCMTFESNAPNTSPMDMECDANWPAAQRNLDRMYIGTEPGYRVTVWFCIPTTNTHRAWREYLTPFADAANDHTPPFHQYLDDDDQPYIRSAKTSQRSRKSAMGCTSGTPRSNHRASSAIGRAR